MSSSASKNPVQTFFSKSNAQNLYRTIRRGLKEHYDVEIDNRYLEQMIDIMKMVIEPLPKRIPMNVDHDWYVKTLNEQAIREALPMFADIAKGKGKMQPGQQQQQQTATAASGGPISFMRRPQSTPLANVGGPSTDTESAYQRLVEDRNPPAAPAPPDHPNFEDPPMEYSDDVNDLYEYAEQQRQVVSLPQMLDPDSLPFDINPQATRTEAAQYQPKPPVQPPRGQSTPLPHLDGGGDDIHFDSNRFVTEGAPRGTERLNREMVRPRRFDNSEFVNRSDLKQAASPENGQMLSFDDIAPQPAQMRVLIPKTSRNLVHDSQQIPHQYVVSSRDRNPTVYPNASEFRLELRQPYIDVVSVELLQVTLPLSAYNVNENNNTIDFEEVDGIVQSATVPIGEYPDATSLGVAVAASMTAASAGGVTYSSSVNPLTGKITLTSDGFGGAIFNLLFLGTPSLEGEGTVEFRREKPQYPDSSIGPVLGYDTADYTGALIYAAPFVPDLSGINAVYMHIDELELLESNNPEIHDAFARIPIINTGAQTFATFEPNTTLRYEKYFSPPLGKLATLTISLRNEDGKIVNFNGRNYSLTLQIITKDKTQGPYQED